MSVAEGRRAGVDEAGVAEIRSRFSRIRRGHRSSRSRWQAGLFLSHGDFYATTAIARLGRADDGVVRAGCACYTSAEEVERLVDGVRAVVTGSARAGRPASA